MHVRAGARFWCERALASSLGCGHPVPRAAHPRPGDVLAWRRRSFSARSEPFTGRPGVGLGRGFGRG
eukprot:4289724-Alexandrium_andersonii.AAC.1